MSQFVNDSLNEALIQANMTLSDMATTVEIMDSLNNYTKQFGAYKIEISGMPMIIAEIHESIVKSQRRSLSMAVLFAFVLVASVFRSVKKGLYSIVPMISSLVILYGFMGWAGIPIDIATVLVGSIGVGVGDYVIHILSGYNYYFKLTNDSNLALQESLKISGRAVIINSMSVSAGFLVLIFSNLVPMRGFGTIVPITLISSALAAITLLPIIIKATSKPNMSNLISENAEASGEIPELK
jgi:predicted RND superfamily exporter protein